MVPQEGGGGTTDKAASLDGVSRTLACLVLALATSVVAGWFLDVRTLTSVVPDYNTMKFNTAVCLLALACALLTSGGTAVASALLVTTVSSTTLGEIWSGRSFGIDELVIADRMTTSAGTAPGRMAPATAVALLTLSVAIILLVRRRNAAVQVVLLVPLVVGVTALLGYLFGVEQLYQVASLSSVAVHTAIALLALTLAVAARVPGGVLPWVVAGNGRGSTMVRQTAPPVILGFTTFGLIRKWLGDLGVFGEHFGIALMVMIGITISVGVTVVAAKRLEAADDARSEAQEDLRTLNQSLVEGRDEAWARAEGLADELVAERERFERAISSTDAVAWTVQVNPHRSRSAYASPNAERVLGERLLPGETAPAALVRLVDADQRAAALDFQRCVHEGIPAEIELRLSVDGHSKWVRVQGVPRDEEAATFYDGVITDSTEQHDLAVQREYLLTQEQLQVERLSELNRIRDDFIAVAGHELRTPVAVILGYLEVLADPHTPEPVRSESIGIIARRAHQLSELVERVFDLAKIDSGAMELTIEPVLVGPFVADLVDEHRPAAEAAGVALAATGGTGTVLADVPRLQQIFDNLLSNALKYTPAGGHVELRVGQHEGTVVFDLVDDGIGVAPEELPHLFDRLFRATSAREARIPGTGLGLAVTKALVEAQGGTLTARANVPNGLVLSVTLPSASRRTGKTGPE